MKLLFIQTGGTIDKSYPATETNHGYNFEITTPAFERILANVHPSFEYEVVSVAQKDSTELNDEDRAAMIAVCRATDIHNIVITHGTDTILESAAALNEIKDKTIVFTGAMLPEQFKNSDADFNVGTAVAGAASLPHGVYVAMGGLVLPWQQMTYDKLTQQFRAIA